MFWCRASKYPASAFPSSMNKMWVRPGAYARLFACILPFRCFFLTGYGCVGGY